MNDSARFKMELNEIIIQFKEPESQDSEVAREILKMNLWEPNNAIAYDIKII